MTRRVRTVIDIGGHGSLLPIIANVVGILIVAAVLMRQRIERLAIPDADSEPRALAELDSRRSSAGAIEEEVLALNEQARRVQNLTASRLAERAALAVGLVAGEKDLAARRAALDAEARQQFDLAHDMAQARAELERLEAARNETKSKPAKVTQIQNYPTPISHVVDGKELHYQLKDGRISVIPLEELLNKFKSIAREKLWRLKDTDEMTDMVGPLGGFQLRYTLEREEMSWEAAQVSGHGGSVIQLTKWELVPVKDNLGETSQEALAPGSSFHESLANLRPAEWTTTLWVYPDSFEVFRDIRRELYQLGFVTAGRPLPAGFPIGGSPQGTKSAAQ